MALAGALKWWWFLCQSFANVSKPVSKCISRMMIPPGPPDKYELPTWNFQNMEHVAWGFPSGGRGGKAWCSAYSVFKTQHVFCIWTWSSSSPISASRWSLTCDVCPCPNPCWDFRALQSAPPYSPLLTQTQRNSYMTLQSLFNQRDHIILHISNSW